MFKVVTEEGFCSLVLVFCGLRPAALPFLPRPLGDLILHSEQELPLPLQLPSGSCALCSGKSLRLIYLAVSTLCVEEHSPPPTENY